MKVKLIMQFQREKTSDMTSGNIYKHLIVYSFPVLLGSLFQLLYNTVDTIIVGQYVSTEALAAVGATSMIIYIISNFFTGIAVGAGVLVGQCFGSKDKDALKSAIQTTFLFTFVFCVILTIIGYFSANPLLQISNTPDTIFSIASKYLRIYFLGISGTLIYTIGSAVLNAVGNTSLPLKFLIFSSITNIILDLFFVLVLHAGVEGVAWASVIAQLLSALLILIFCSTTKEMYRIQWRGIHIEKSQLKKILSIGMPAGIQAIITGLANLIVQAYINTLGSICIAAWNCYAKILNIAMLPTISLSSATTNFVSQNIGAKDFTRVKTGIVKSNMLNVGVSAVISLTIFVLAKPLIGIYTSDSEVIKYGVLFTKCNVLGIIYHCVGDNLVNAMIATGDSRMPTRIKLIFSVGTRILYLFIVTSYISSSPIVVSLAFPVSWAFSTIAIYIYYDRYWKKHIKKIDNRPQTLLHLILKEHHIISENNRFILH